MSHGITKCRGCEVVIQRCKCVASFSLASCGVITWDACEKCRAPRTTPKPDAQEQREEALELVADRALAMVDELEKILTRIGCHDHVDQQTVRRAREMLEECGRREVKRTTWVDRVTAVR